MGAHEHVGQTYSCVMMKWEYVIYTTRWIEESRSVDYATHIKYRHIWQPGDEIQTFASGMSASLGSKG